jgi:arylsulfatase A-like enzyme
MGTHPKSFVRRAWKIAALLGAGAVGVLLAYPAYHAPELRPVRDLARRAPVADFEAGFQAILFGTPAAEALQENGFRREGRQDEGDVWAAAAPTARLLLRWPEAGPRRAVLDVEPYPGVAGQRLEVALNGTSVATFKLLEGRRRYAFDLPQARQRPGGNRIRLRFGEEDPAPERQPSRARLYSLAVGLAGDPGLHALASSGAPPVLSVSGGPDGRDLVQSGPSVLRHAVVLPEAAELRFTPAGTAGARLRITFREEGGPTQELWALESATEANTEDVRLRLPGAAGTPVVVGLHVEAREGSAASAVWRSPQIWGLAPAPEQPLLRSSAAETRKEELDALRRSLQGMHVLLIVLDAAGARHFSSYGYARRTTPEIDRLAGEGLLFERAYTPAPFTYAAMAALWTSQVPDEGRSEWIRDGDGVMPPERLTLAELLSANGVPAAGFVANPSASIPFGLSRGFAEFHEVFTAPWSEDGVPNAEVAGEAFRQWRARAPSGRSFAYLHFREPHYPYAPPAPFDALFASGAPAAPRPADWQADLAAGRRAPTPDELDLLIRLYDANLAYADREIGRLRRDLEQAGLWEQTVVIVTADHGEAMFEHGWVGHNTQVYEESVRIPLIVRFPRGAGVAPARIASLTSLLDVAPTIADVFGLRERATGRFRGRSLLADAVGAARGSSVVSRTSGSTYALVHGPYKLIHDMSSAGEELYDLEADPGERVNLAERHPVRAAMFRQALHRWLLDLRGPALPPAAPPKLDPQQRKSLRALGYLR